MSRSNIEDEMESGDWNSQVFEQIYQRAQSGDVSSQFSLGMLFSGKSGLVPPNAKKQVEWYQKACEQDHWPSMNNLGLLYENGVGVEKSESKAFELFYKASHHEDQATAQFNLGRCYESGIGVVKDIENAFKWYKVSAKSGSPESNYKCGFFLFDGIGRTKDLKAGFEFFQKAAEKEHVHSMYLVGYCLQNGLGTEQNDAFIKWYQKAADAGHARANFKLAQCYDDGLGVEADFEKALHFFNQAANNGNNEAKFKLYKKLAGQLTDEAGKEKLKKLLEQSAESGFKEARHTLAKCLLDGDLFSKDVDRAMHLIERSVDDGDHGVYFMAVSIPEEDLTSERRITLKQIIKKSADLFNEYAAYEYAQQCEVEENEEAFKEAHHYYSSAAALGHYSAAFELARCYKLGIGCDEKLPRETASIYYYQAFVVGMLAHKGLTELAGMYGDGIGVPKNYVFAYALSNFAAAAGEEKAITLRDSLETKMSNEQIAKAQDMTHEWNDLSQIKDNKFFPEWMHEPPEYTLLQKEAAAKKRKKIESNANFSKLLLNLFEKKVNDGNDMEDKS
jgi:TPR repeat protein